MKKLLLILLVLNLLSNISVSQPENFVSQNPEYKLVFEDNFDYFDKNKWNIDTEERHSAINSRDAIKINDSKLEIRPFTIQKQHYSGVINTENKFEFNKGYIEIRAKFSDLPGTWSCFWLYKDSAGLDEANVLDNGLEIDIFEHRKYDCNNKDISGYLNHTIHWNGYGKYHKCAATDTGNLNLNDNNFHIISLLWDDEGYTFFVDGKQTWKIQEPKTKTKLFLVLSTEIGFLDFWTVPPPDKIESSTITVDYIKVWQKPTEK